MKRPRTADVLMLCPSCYRDLEEGRRRLNTSKVGAPAPCDFCGSQARRYAVGPPIEEDEERLRPELRDERREFEEYVQEQLEEGER